MDQYRVRRFNIMAW